MNRQIYLDANAWCPPLPQAKEAILKALDIVGNPSSPHRFGRQARAMMDASRLQCAEVTGFSEQEVYFTSGVSESSRWVIDALDNLGRSLNRRLTVVTSALEHPSMRKRLAQATELDIYFISISKSGVLELPDALSQADALLLSGAHNETGLIWPWEAILSKVKPDCIVYMDAAQSFSRISLPLERVDALSLSGQKIGGIAGAGLLNLRNNALKLQPPWPGPGQEKGVRPGTEPFVAIHALAAAISQIHSTRTAYQHIEGIKDQVEAHLSGLFDDLDILLQEQQRLPNTTAITFPSVDGSALRMKLDRLGLAVGFGSACSGLAPEPSPGLLALGLTEQEAQSTVRISLPPTLSEADFNEICHRFDQL